MTNDEYNKKKFIIECINTIVKLAAAVSIVFITKSCGDAVVDISQNIQAERTRDSQTLESASDE